MFLSEWREFPSAPCLAGVKKNLMTALVSMLLKSRASLTCFRACFLPGPAKDLSAPRYVKCLLFIHVHVSYKMLFNLMMMMMMMSTCYNRSKHVAPLNTHLVVLTVITELLQTEIVALI